MHSSVLTRTRCFYGFNVNLSHLVENKEEISSTPTHVCIYNGHPRSDLFFVHCNTEQDCGAGMWFQAQREFLIFYVNTFWIICNRIVWRDFLKRLFLETEKKGLLKKCRWRSRGRQRCLYRSLLDDPRSVKVVERRRRNIPLVVLWTMSATMFLLT
jgi:hypothetical protein